MATLKGPVNIHKENIMNLNLCCPSEDTLFIKFKDNVLVILQTKLQKEI